MINIKEIIEKNLVPFENYIYGIADLRGILNHNFGDYSSGILIGKKLEDDVIDKIENGPTFDYLKAYYQIEEGLADTAENIKTGLTEIGIDSIVIHPTAASDSENYQSYLKTLRWSVSHKMIATRAGLGWIGKTDLFISKKFGPRLKMASILMKEVIADSGKPVEKSRCGKCNVCVERCPAGAATGKLWDINTDRDVFFDPYKCKENCYKISKRMLNIDEELCGICMSVCPIGRKNRINRKNS